MDLSTARNRISQVDRKLVELLNERARLSLNVGAAKRQTLKEQGEDGEPEVYVPGQEKRVFEKVRGLNQGPLSGESVCAIYREIMSASISLQSEVSVGYLGPPGTFSHQAATKRFGDSLAYMSYAKIEDVITAVAKEEVTYGLVPIENSTFGVVVQTLDSFVQQPTVKIRAEVFMPVTQSLLSRYQLSAIRKVYSHPQAFGQSRQWLDQHLPNAARVEVSSTAKAAELAAAENYAAAISSEVCASLYHLDVVAKDITTASDNTTRFFVLGQSSDNPTGDDKTLLMFTVDHREPGALCSALDVFAKHKINQTAINSRPSRQRQWHYMFFVEIIGHELDDNVAKALKEIKAYCLDLVVLGSYPHQYY
ncbi:prephenate dehydratase [Coemansia sp. RSA 989]|nr:Prephenate dehydratase-domain-containing protein [Coemansia mojavensis]KAJ1742228.1 prephenate dehydratase [Coemansia sp. RSA 1086]KAJ1750575.1 prephenate dehydratase [Coemansia sp. RSA 1821]KAJ1865165.1 prephenate dehydratase [Coemansia sp. RSA 989]KAJ1872494.1 prephenate dehydratase [Coemansia sp. RSA 990]KAJ2653518.1 prephenate dehydratase [Coemansia sp. RSA 1250]KAJ2677233.1 prephenate dehydratase [Coemansia sp. RSA 1085]